MGTSTTSDGQPEARVLTGGNPFEVPAEMDLPRPPQYDVPNYSETYYYSIWDPAQGVGVLLHIGRVRNAIDLWWARTIAYLPGDRLIIDRSFGRSRDDRGPSSGNLTLHCNEPMVNWTLSFDGAGEDTTRDAAARSPIGAGPFQPMSFQLDATAMFPVWDLPAALQGGRRTGDPSGMSGLSSHLEQAMKVTGELVVGDQRWQLDAIAYRDHSWGPRDLEGWDCSSFFYAIFPESGRLMSGVQLYDTPGHAVTSIGYICENDQLEIVTDLDLPLTRSVAKASPELPISMRRLDGTRISLVGRVHHGVPITIGWPNMNVNGVLPDPSRSLVLNEDTGSYETADGEMGYGASERGLSGATLVD
jgi:hypothetical protein